MDNKLWIGLGVTGGVIIIILLTFLLFFKPDNTATKTNIERDNIIKIVKRYYEKGEYDRALNQIEEILKKNIDDHEAIELQDMIIDAKKNKLKTEEEFRDAKDREAREKLFSNVNTAIERRDEKPVIIRRETSPDKDELSDKKSKEENEKKKLINKLIDEGFNEYNSQNYTKAKNNFLKVLEMDPDNAEANAALAATIFDENPDDNKSIEEAVNRSQKAIKKDENSELAHLTLAKIYAKREMNDQSIEEYKKSVQINPNNYDSFYNLGKLYFKAKDYKKSSESFKSAVNIKKDFVNGYFYLGLTEYKLNNKNEAKNAYQNAIKLDPNFYEAYANMGEIYRLENDFSNALNYYKKAAAINNKYAIQKKIGESYEMMKKNEDAIESYMMSISLNPLATSQDKKIATECYVSISNIKNIQNKYPEAIDFVKKGIEIDNENPNLYFMCGFSNDKLNNIVEAEENYVKAIELNKNYIQAYVNLSSIYNKNGKYQESIDLLGKAVNFDNTNYMLYNNLGDSQQKIGKYDEAIDSYKKSISLNSSDANIYFNMGLCYKSINNQESAAIILKKAVELNKNNIDALYELGESYFLLQKYDDAKKIFDSLLNIKPDYNKKDKIESMKTVINGIS